MEICNKHGICFDAVSCPACELESRIQELENEMDNFKWQIHLFMKEKEKCDTQKG